MYDILHVAYLPKGKYLSVGICYKQKVVSQAACPSNCYPVLVLAQLCVVVLFYTLMQVPCLLNK